MLRCDSKELCRSFVCFIFKPLWPWNLSEMTKVTDISIKWMIDQIVRYLLIYTNRGDISVPNNVLSLLFIGFFCFVFRWKWDGCKILLYLFSLYENRVTDQLIYHHNWLGDFPTISLVVIDGHSYGSFIRKVTGKPEVHWELK